MADRSTAGRAGWRSQPSGLPGALTHCGSRDSFRVFARPRKCLSARLPAGPRLSGETGSSRVRANEGLDLERLPRPR